MVSHPGAHWALRHLGLEIPLATDGKSADACLVEELNPED